MVASTANIRAALVTALNSVYGETWQVSPYFLANPTTPAMDVTPAGIVYDTAMARGMDDVTYTVRAIVALGLDEAAQQNLDSLLDLDPSASLSMKNTLEADRTLGGIVQDLHVTEASEYRVYPVDQGSAVIGVEFTVKVLR